MAFIIHWTLIYIIVLWSHIMKTTDEIIVWWDFFFNFARCDEKPLNSSLSS